MTAAAIGRKIQSMDSNKDGLVDIGELDRLVRLI